MIDRHSRASLRRARPRMLTIAMCAVIAATSTTACSPGEETAEGVRTVRFWQVKFEDYQQTWFAERVQEFNETHPNITIEYEAVPGDAWDTKLNAARAAGSQPDVITTAYAAIKPGVANGQFLPLEDLISAEAIADIQPSVGEMVRKDGTLYAYPMHVELSTVVFYRKDLFVAAGLDPDEPPASWDDLIDAARKLTTGGVYGMNVAQTAVDLGWSTWGLQYNATGHLPISADWSAPDLDDAGFRELAELYRTLYADGLMPPEPPAGYADITPYGEGKLAMTACGSWAIATLANEYPEIMANTGVAAFPSIDGSTGKPTSTLGGWSLTVDAKTEVAAEAGEFIEWILGDEQEPLVQFFASSKFSKYPTRISVADALATAPEAPQYAFIDVINTQIVPFAKPEPTYPFDVSLAFGTALETIMKGAADIDTAFADAEAAIADVIDRQGLAGTAS